MLGLVEREGGLDLSVVKNVQTQTIQPIMEGAIAANTTIYTVGYVRFIIFSIVPPITPERKSVIVPENMRWI